MGKSRKRRNQRKATFAAAVSSSNRKAKLSLVPEPWDHGADGPANRKGLVKEERGEMDPDTGKVKNPNGVTGVRRVDLLEFWRNRGTISQEGYTAGMALRLAFDATMKGKPALPDNDRVQSSPKPDHAVTIQIDRVSRFHSVMRHVEAQDKKIITACVLHGEHPARVYGSLRSREGLEHIREALDRLADSLAGVGKRLSNIR